MALPYCYFYLVDWKICKATKFQVVKDLIYIFFKLKHFPDIYSLCRMWETDRNYWKYYYGSIYDAYQRHRLQIHVQPKEYQILFEDKYVCYQLCQSSGIPLPKQHGCIFPNQLYHGIISDLLDRNESKKIIIKPLRGKGGKDIYIAYHREGNHFITGSHSTLPLTEFKLAQPSVLQDYVDQHERLSSMSNSINTLRIITLLTKKNEALVVCGTARFGLEGSFIDNMSAGGLGVGINIENGRLFPKGFDFHGNQYLHHPQSRIDFHNFEIPMWEEVLSLARKTQEIFFYYKLLGLDIAITPERPIIIEVNNSPDTASEEMNAPLLLDEKIRKEFMEYDLLVNNLLYQHN